MNERSGAPLISIIVRSHNDKPLLRRTLDSLFHQTVSDFEILCVDDHSDDGSREMISLDSRIRLLDPPAPYMPGRVMNFAAAQARGKWLVFNNSDAVPLEERYLENLLAPLFAGTADLVYGCQTPRPDAWPLVRKDYERAFGDGRIAAGWKHFFSMASSAVGRDLLREHPFLETLRYSEDIEWSWRLRGEGFRIAYAANARTEHSHNYGPGELRRRFYNEGAANRRIFGRGTGLSRMLCGLAKEILRDAVYLLRHGESRYLAQGLYYRVIQRFSVYIGEKSGKFQ